MGDWGGKERTDIVGVELEQVGRLLHAVLLEDSLDV
jgi:hypothetical protein